MEIVSNPAVCITETEEEIIDNIEMKIGEETGKVESPKNTRRDHRNESSSKWKVSDYITDWRIWNKDKQRNSV